MLRREAWGPILKVVDEREKAIAASIESAKRERAEAERLLAEQKEAIAEGRRRGRGDDAARTPRTWSGSATS